MSTLAVVPARGGSKAIPRKNIRLLAGKPLISHILQTLKKCKNLDQIVVTSDSEEIIHIAEMEKVLVIKRPENLATDATTLDPVIHHAVNYLEKQMHLSYTNIMTVQPTSPLLSVHSTEHVIQQFIDQPEIDSIISVVDDRHLSWTFRDGKYIPLYEKRINRQYLPPNFRETGGFLLTRRVHVSETNRLGKNIHLFEIPRLEAIDIDHEVDWWVAEKLLQRKKILIRVDGNHQIGLGHIYRMLSLADHLIDHNILFVSQTQNQLGINLIKESNYRLVEIEDMESFDLTIAEYQPDIIINDILDTEPAYMKHVKSKARLIVNFEDLGSGAQHADLVINALYEEKLPLENHYWGEKYYCLRNEFQLLPRKEITPSVNNILITFGGTDPNNYSKRIIHILNELNFSGLVTVVVGLGYRQFEELVNSAKNFKIKVEFKQHVKNISRMMHDADLAFTSAGRTVYELASLGIPTIVIAQNEREMRHTFARTDNGIINMGLGWQVTDEDIKETTQKLVNDYQLRNKCHQLMLDHNLRSGIKNVLDLISNHYHMKIRK